MSERLQGHRSLAGSLQGCLIIYKYCMSDTRPTITIIRQKYLNCHKVQLNLSGSTLLVVRQDGHPACKK